MPSGELVLPKNRVLKVAALLVGPCAINEAPAGQELEEVMARLGDLAPGGRSAPQHIPGPLLRLGEGLHRRELPCQVDAGPLDGVGLLLDAAAAGDERRGGIPHSRIVRRSAEPAQLAS